MVVKVKASQEQTAAPVTAKPAPQAPQAPVQQELPYQQELTIEREPDAQVNEEVAIESSSFEYYALTVHDQHFPEALKGQYPHTLFFHGNLALLSTPMIAVVTRGKSTMLESCRQLGKIVAGKGKTLLIGSARDEDMYFIAGALEANGNVVVALHHGLEEERIPAELEAWVEAGRVLFISFSLPNSRYTEDRGKERNAVMVALSEYTIAAQVSAKAGSWDLCQQTIAAGKIVRILPTSDAGNQALIKMNQPNVKSIGYK